MEILFFLYKFPVVSETFVLNQIAYFISKGYSVQIVSVFPGDDNIEHAVIKEFDLIQRTHYLLEKDSKNKVLRSISRVFSIIPIFFNRKKLKSLNYRKYGHYSKNLLIPSILSKNKNNFHADVIISHFGTISVLAYQLRLLGVLNGKLAAVFHGNDISHKRTLHIFKNDYVRLCKEAEFILPISELWAKKIKSLSGREDNVHVIRMGIRTEKFIFNPKSYLNNPIKLLSIARLTEKKGISIALQACQLLKKEKIPFHYTIIGDGPLRSKLELQVIELGLENEVFFIGSKAQEVVSSYLSISDLFLLPSVTALDGDMEGIPVVLMEAMAIGIPVISTFHSGIPELIENGVSGFLVNENDPIGIYNVIRGILNSPEDLEDICVNAKQKIDEEFEQDKSYSKMSVILSL